MNLNEILGIKYPIIQGAMANISDAKFAAAVSNSGAMGIIATAVMPPETVRQEIKLCKTLTDKPFGVNLMLMNPQIDEIADIIIEEGVKFITTGAGNPGKYMQKWKDAGIVVFPVVPNSTLARRMEKAGADGVIAEGTESGGHVGELTTMALIPQVVSAVNIPVVAAGGIASGKQVLAAEILGAYGVQIGTCLLTSEECPVHENYKNAVINSKDSDTVVTGRNSGVPVRVLKNPMTREHMKLEKSGADKMELEKYTVGALRRAVVDGDVKTGSVMAGQVAGMVSEIKPLDEIFESLMSEYNEIKKQITVK